MDKENEVYVDNGVLFSHKEAWNLGIYSNRNETRGYYIKEVSQQRKTNTTCSHSSVETNKNNQS
jgi:hypothetical protein